MDGPMQSLAEFAAEQRSNRGPRCWVCTSVPPDLLEEIHAEYRRSKGAIGATTITRWLLQLGHEGATKDRLHNHLQNHLER